MTEILNGIKVVELATVLAGPLVGSFLGEHGAEVVKIEPPGGDVTRNWKHPNEEGASYFAACNWNKTSLELNLKGREGSERLRELIRQADIVISNFLPRVEKKLNLTSDHIKDMNPKVIHVKLLGYPDSEKPAYDAVLQAETGWMGLNGTPETGPLKLPVAIVDLFAAHHMKQAVLLALIKKASSGEGSVIRCDLESSAISNLANQASLSLAGVSTQASGSLHPNIAPYGETLIFSNDEHVLLAIGSDAHFLSLIDILGVNHLADDERYASNSRRVANRGELILELQGAVKNMQVDEFIKRCFELKVPVGKVNSIEKVLAKPHVDSLVVEDEWGKRITTSPFSIE